VNVTMFAPVREKCGISDYSRALIAHLPDKVTVIPAPEIAAFASGAALRQQFSALGAQMNSGEVAHVQHQYFLFGGVSPLKNHAILFLRAVQVPTVLTVHEIVMPQPGDGFLRRMALNLTNRNNFFQPLIRAYIVHTAQDRERLQTLGIPAERITVLPVGVPEPLPTPTAADAKQQLGLTGKRVLTLFGFLSAKKGHRQALAALFHLPDDVVLLFVGDQHPDDHSDSVSQLKAEIEASALQSRVQITGFIPAEQIPVYMAAADIALAPYRETSGSASLATLFAYSKPIIASDIAPHREIAQQTNGLLLCDTENAAEFAVAIRSVLESDAQRTQLIAGAREYAEKFSYREMARRTHEIYEQVRASK